MIANVPFQMSENPIMAAAHTRKRMIQASDNMISERMIPIKSCHGGVFVDSACSAVPKYASSIAIFPSFEMRWALKYQRLKPNNRTAASLPVCTGLAYNVPRKKINLMISPIVKSNQ